MAFQASISPTLFKPLCVTFFFSSMNQAIGPHDPPTFLLDVSTTDAGVPRSVTIRPMLIAGAQVDIMDVYNTIALTLRNRTVNAIRQHTGWSANQVNERINGMLKMENLGDQRHAHTENVRLGELDGAEVSEIFDRASGIVYLTLGQGSNSNLTIYEVEWTYWINPNSLLVGAGRAKSSVSGVYPTSEIALTWNGEEVSCAAVVIGLWVATRTGKIKNGKNIGAVANRPKLFKLCKSYEKKFGWGHEVTIEQLSEVVNDPEFSHCRIVIVNPTIKSSRSRDWAGADYVYNEQENIIYVHYDFEDKHFMLINSPRAFVAHKHPSRLWCAECSCWYTSSKSGTTGCECGNAANILKVVKDRVKKTCLECNQVFI